MGTEAIIARPTDPADPSKFAGMYVSGDGYPQHTGRAIWRAYHLHFKGDVEAMAAYYIDQHPTGWRMLGADAVGRDECFCHDLGEGEQSGWTRNQDQVSSIDYTYVLRPEGLEVMRFGWAEGKVLIPWGDEDTFVNWVDLERQLVGD